MFGYVNVLKDELKVKEYSFYRAVYCGVCTACGKGLSHASKLGLSYDAAFAALLLLSVSVEPVEAKKRRCIANPFKKRQYIASKSIDYAASAWAILAYYKFLDDWRDNKNPKALLGLMFFSKAKKKAAKKFPGLLEKIDTGIKKLSELENKNCTDVDLPSAVSGEMLAACLTPPYIGRESLRQLEEMGKNLGRWIYLMDAADDFDKDKKRGSYNPLVLNFKNKKEAAEKSREHMTYTLSSMALSYELLEIKKNKSILDNIIYLGVAAKQQEVLEEKTNESV